MQNTAQVKFGELKKRSHWTKQCSLAFIIELMKVSFLVILKIRIKKKSDAKYKGNLKQLTVFEKNLTSLDNLN